MEDPDGLYRRAFGGALRGQHGGGNEGLSRKLREELSSLPASRGRAKRGHRQARLRGEHPALHAPEREAARQHAGPGRPHARDFRTLRADSAREASPAPRLRSQAAWSASSAVLGGALCGGRRHADTGSQDGPRQPSQEGTQDAAPRPGHSREAGRRELPEARGRRGTQGGGRAHAGQTRASRRP